MKIAFLIVATIVMVFGLAFVDKQAEISCVKSNRSYVQGTWSKVCK